MSRFQPLSPKLADQRWQRYTDFRHAKGLMTLPLAAPEMSQAAAHLPLVFVKTEGRYVLSALVGLQADTNHNLDEHDHWLPGYTPAWLRTPPFRLTVPPGAQPTQRVLSIDMQSPWLHPDGDQRLLDADHQMVPAVQEVATFLTKLEKHYAKTQQAVDALANLGVLAPWRIQGADGAALPHLYRIDEAAFQQLEDAALATLRKRGALAVAYTQMISTHQLPSLKRRAEAACVDEVNLDAFFGEEDDELRFSF